MRRRRTLSLAKLQPGLVGHRGLFLLFNRLGFVRAVDDIGAERSPQEWMGSEINSTDDA